MCRRNFLRLLPLLDIIKITTDFLHDVDYNPCEPDDEKVEGEESSSDESEYASATKELEAPPQDEQYLGLPSDDSEDDDYDPESPDLYVMVEKGSSSSGFTSGSEDLAAALDDNRPSRDDEGPTSTSLDGIKPLRGSAPVSRRRQVERLDYKELHDVTAFLRIYNL